MLFLSLFLGEKACVFQRFARCSGGGKKAFSFFATQRRRSFLFLQYSTVGAFKETSLMSQVSYFPFVPAWVALHTNATFNCEKNHTSNESNLLLLQSNNFAKYFSAKFIYLHGCVAHCNFEWLKRKKSCNYPGGIFAGHFFCTIVIITSLTIRAHFRAIFPQFRKEEGGGEREPSFFYYNCTSLFFCMIFSSSLAKKSFCLPLFEPRFSSRPNHPLLFSSVAHPPPPPPSSKAGPVLQ